MSRASRPGSWLPFVVTIGHIGSLSVFAARANHRRAPHEWWSYLGGFGDDVFHDDEDDERGQMGAAKAIPLRLEDIS